MVTLKNKRRRMLVFNLDAPFFVKNRNETPYGQSCVLTFLALEKKEGIHDAVLGCSEIQVAVQNGDLRIMKQTKDEPTQEPSAAMTSMDESVED
jgi:hypothetical protein